MAFLPIFRRLDRPDRQRRATKNKPQRPSGIERNIVVTTWDWSTSDKYLHDLISSDRRDPTVNANGKLYGAPEYSTDDVRSSTRRRTLCRTSRCPWPIRTCRCRLDQVTPARSRRFSRHPTGGTRRCGTRGPTSTTPCSTSKGDCGLRRPFAGWPIPTGARKAQSTPPPRCSPRHFAAAGRDA